MFGWKKKVDDYLEEERLKREAKEKERKAQKGRAEQDAYNKALVILQRRFKCYLCGKPASGPYYKGGTPSRGTPWDWEPGSPGKPDWDSPRGLEICSRCHRWTCTTHIHSGICQKCAEKL